MALYPIYDPAFRVTGWFDSTATVEGWFDDAFSNTADTTENNTAGALSTAVASSTSLDTTKSISGELAIATAVSELLLDVNETASTALGAQVATSADLVRTTPSSAALTASVSASATLDRVLSGSVRAYTHAAEILSKDENSPDVQVYTHAAEALSQDQLNPAVRIYTHAAEVLTRTPPIEIEPAFVFDVPYNEDDPYNSDDTYNGATGYLSGHVAVRITAEFAPASNDISGALSVSTESSAELTWATSVDAVLPVVAGASAELARTASIDAALSVTSSTLAATVWSGEIAGAFTATVTATADLERLAANDISASLTIDATATADTEIATIAVDAASSIGVTSAAEIGLNQLTDASLAIGVSTASSTTVDLGTAASLGVQSSSAAALTRSCDISGSLHVSSTRSTALNSSTGSSGSRTEAMSSTAALTRKPQASAALSASVTSSADIDYGSVKGIYGSLAITASPATPGDGLSNETSTSASLPLTVGLWATDYKPGDVYTIPVGRATESDSVRKIDWFRPDGSLSVGGPAIIRTGESRKPRPERPFEIKMAEHAREGFLGGVGGALASPSPVPSPLMKKRTLQATAPPAMLFYQDSFPVGGSSYKLTFIPIKFSEHAYLKKPSGEHVYQKQGETWDRADDSKNVTVTGTMAAMVGDVLVFEYAYYANQPVETAEDVWFHAYKIATSTALGIGSTTGQAENLHGATVTDNVSFITWSDQAGAVTGVFGVAVHVDPSTLEITCGPVLTIKEGGSILQPVGTEHIGTHVVAVGIYGDDTAGAALAKFIKVDSNTLVSTVIGQATAPVSGLSEAFVITDGQNRAAIAMDHWPSNHTAWVTVSGTPDSPNLSITQVAHGDSTNDNLYSAVYWQAWCFTSDGMLVSYGGNINDRLTVYSVDWNSRTCAHVRDIVIPNMSVWPGEGDVVPAATPGHVDILNVRTSFYSLALILDCPIDGSAVPSPTLTLTSRTDLLSNGPYWKYNWLRTLRDGTRAFTWKNYSYPYLPQVYRYTGLVEYGSSTDVGRTHALADSPPVTGYPGQLFLDLGDTLLYVFTDGNGNLLFRSGQNSAEYGPGPALPAGADDFADAPVIELPALGAASSAPTNIASFSREPDETDYYIAQWWYVNNTAWWSFTPTKTGIYIFHTEWSVPYDEYWWNDTELVVLHGTSLQALWWDDSDSGSGIGASSYIYWGVELDAGTTYHISVGCGVDDFDMPGYRIDVVLSVAWAAEGESFT